MTVNEDKAGAEQEQEWLRQLSLIYSGLIVIGVYLVAPFLTAASLDLSASHRVTARLHRHVRWVLERFFHAASG